jgi:hypothetical protein
MIRNGYQNEDLMVWMRTAAFPSFRKLYGRILLKENSKLMHVTYDLDSLASFYLRIKKKWHELNKNSNKTNNDLPDDNYYGFNKKVKINDSEELEQLDLDSNQIIKKTLNETSIYNKRINLKLPKGEYFIDINYSNYFYLFKFVSFHFIEFLLFFLKII